MREPFLRPVQHERRKKIGPIARLIEAMLDFFGDLDRLAPEDAILASNSSSYPTSQFIDAVSRPGRVVNTHYYRIVGFLSPVGLLISIAARGVF